jgi:hypothetical protein
MLPSEYFVTDVERPQNGKEHLLDFTYLFDSSVENEDYDTMLKGIQVREDEATTSPADKDVEAMSKNARRLRMTGRRAEP